jgi:hypothetical protein
MSSSGIAYCSAYDQGFSMMSSRYRFEFRRRIAASAYDEDSSRPKSLQDGTYDHVLRKASGSYSTQYAFEVEALFSSWVE